MREVRRPRSAENRYFDYDEIEDLGIDPNFEKGSRSIGYGTPNISSGKFKNSMFGPYVLMSYTKVDSCVFFTYDGSYYAFNQSTEEATMDAYLELKSIKERNGV